MKITLVLIFLLIIFSSGCISQQIATTTLKPLGCTSNSDCDVGGCSSQICALKEQLKNLATTCEWLEEYKCLDETSCVCINGTCKWKENDEYKKCIEYIKSPTNVSTCDTDSDCIPESCCHPRGCVSIRHKPYCEDIMCTQECRPNTMDCCPTCKCYCSGGVCQAELNTGIF